MPKYGPTEYAFAELGFRLRQSCQIGLLTTYNKSTSYSIQRSADTVALMPFSKTVVISTIQYYISTLVLRVVLLVTFVPTFGDRPTIYCAAASRPHTSCYYNNWTKRIPFSNSGYERDLLY